MAFRVAAVVSLISAYFFFLSLSLSLLLLDEDPPPLVLTAVAVVFALAARTSDACLRHSCHPAGRIHIHANAHG